MTALFASIGGAWLTAALALRNARRGRWWEKKAEAYERVISAIEHLHFSAAGQIEMLTGGAGENDLSPREQERWRESRRELSRTLHTATLLLSFEVMPVLNSYLQRNRGSEDLMAEVEKDFVASGNCMARLIQIARRDLGMRPLELERFPGESKFEHWKRRMAARLGREVSGGH